MYQPLSTSRSPAREPVFRGIDFITLLLAMLIHAGLIGLTLAFRFLPLSVSLPAGALLLAWYNSLQHEIIHGHPTASRRFNALLACIPWTLWLPYARYRAMHLRHHRHHGRYLTDAARDPESYYLEPGAFDRLSRPRRWLHRVNCTLAGRVLVGPALSMGAFWSAEYRRLRSSHRATRAIWRQHLLAVIGLLVWLHACQVPIALFIIGMVYPGVALGLLRSFAEHRADKDERRRTRTVEAGWFWGLIFLNNNLHIAHHAYPSLPWHQLPRTWRAMGATVNDAALVVVGGYFALARQHLSRPVITVEHPHSLPQSR